MKQQLEISKSIEHALLSESFTLSLFTELLHGMALMKVSLVDLPSSTRGALDIQWKKIPKTDLSLSFQTLSHLGRLGKTFADIRSDDASAAMLSDLTYGLLAEDVTSDVIKAAIECFQTLGVTVGSHDALSDAVVNILVTKSFDGCTSHGDKVLWSLTSLRKIGILFSDFPAIATKHLWKSLSVVIRTGTQKSSSADMKVLLDILTELRLMRVTWSDIKAEVQDQLKAFTTANQRNGQIAELISALIDERRPQLIADTKDPSLRRAKTLSSELIKNSEAGDHAAKSISQPEVSLPKDTMPDLNQKLPRLSNADFLRVVFMLGKRRVPGARLHAGGTLAILDDRLLRLLSDLSPAAVIAVLTSLGRMNLKASHFPLSCPELITHVSASASALDSRTLKTALKAMFCLGITWEQISGDQRMGIVAGVARSASTTPNSFGALLGVLDDLGVPWLYLHEKIHIVLRHVIYTAFSDLTAFLPSQKPSRSDNDSAGELAAARWENAFEILVQLAKMDATWEHMGDKACVAVLKALTAYADTGSVETGALALPSAVQIFRGVGVDVSDRLERYEKTEINSLFNYEVFRL